MLHLAPHINQASLVLNQAVLGLAQAVLGLAQDGLCLPQISKCRAAGLTGRPVRICYKDLIHPTKPDFNGQSGFIRHLITDGEILDPEP